MIREATRQDVPGITELWKELTDFHSARDPYYQRSPKGHADWAQFAEGVIDGENGAIFIAEHARSTVGYCLALVQERPPIFLKRRYGEILDIAVTAKHRREGVGETLLNAAVAWFREQGLCRVELRVSTQNEVSTAFWKGMGFAAYVETMFREY